MPLNDPFELTQILRNLVASIDRIENLHLTKSQMITLTADNIYQQIEKHSIQPAKWTEKAEWLREHDYILTIRGLRTSRNNCWSATVDNDIYFYGKTIGEAIEKVYHYVQKREKKDAT